MLSWLTKLEPVHVVTTREEREAVFRFRYDVYYQEFGRSLGETDHERRWVYDSYDEKDFATILYTGTLDDMTGTVRLLHWAPGTVPENDHHELSMDLFPDIDQRFTGEIGRFMIRKSLRGKLLLAAFARETYDLLCGEHNAELVFCYCSPGLVSYYRKLGARPFGGRLVHTPDGMMVPLVSVVSDHDYYKRFGSPLAPLVRRHFGRGKRAPVDIEPYRRLFASDATVELDDEKVWAEVQNAFVEPDSEESLFLHSLPESVMSLLTQKGFIIQVTAGTLVTREDFGEEEMYLILDGELEAIRGEQRLRLMGKGELFGELAFFVPGHRRTASVRAVTDGRLLAVRARTLRQLIKADPATAAQLLVRIGAVMAGRLASGPEPSAGEGHQPTRT